MAHTVLGARSTRTGGLQQIRVGPKVGTLMLTVGGVGTLPPEHWTNSKGELWLGTVDAASAPDIGILSFPNKLATNGILSGREVEEEGAALLAELQRLTEDETVSKAPIVLVAHSLGGLIVKRAICVAKQSPKTYRKMIRKIAGFIFMGCPHSSSRDTKEWTGVQSILQKFTKGRKNSLGPQCIERLAVDCEIFRATLAEEGKKVLTVSEKKGMNKQVIGKKVVFVNKDSATIGYKEETVIEDDSNHRDLCMRTGGGGTLNNIVDFLHLALSDTRKAIATDSPPYTRPSVFDDSTVRDQSSDEEDLVHVSTASTSARNTFRNPDLSILTPSDTTPSINRESWTKEATAGSEMIKPELISALKDFSIQQRDPVLPCKYIPLPRDAVFSGREDTLVSLRQALLDVVDKPENESNSSLSDMATPLNVYSLCGPAGMGKSSIANEFVHRYEKDFDAVFWVAADEETKLFNGFREIALKLGIIAKTDN